MTGETLKPTRAQDYVSETSFLHRASPKLVVRIRKADPLELIFGGMLSLPMLEAAEKFEKLKEGYDNAETQEERGDLTGQLIDAPEKQQLVKFAREYACKMVIEPKITMQDTGKPDDLWVERLDFMELMSILNAEDPAERSTPTNQEAMEFRRPEPKPVAPPEPTGESVRDETKLISTRPERDYISA